MHTFDLELSGTLDLAATFERYRRWGDDLLSRWDGHTFVSTARLSDIVLPYACTIGGERTSPRLRVEVNDPAHAQAVATTLLGSFVQPVDDEWRALLDRDQALAAIERAAPGVRPMLQQDGVTALVRAISTQQVNLAWAATTRRRLAQLAGVLHVVGPHEVYSLSPERLAAASVAQLRSLQFTTRKAEYLREIATAVVSRRLNLDELPILSDDDVVTRLTSIRGIGRWSAEWYLARTLGRPVVVAGDLGVRKVVGALYLSGAMPSEAQTRELTAHWRASSGVALEVALFALHRLDILSLAVAAAGTRVGAAPT